jgi:hypothetical protein
MHQTAWAVVPLNTDPKWPQGYIAVFQLRLSRLFRPLADEAFVNDLEKRFQLRLSMGKDGRPIKARKRDKNEWLSLVQFAGNGSVSR